MKIRFEPIDIKYINDAKEIILSAYDEECNAVPCLPSDKSYCSKSKENINANKIGEAITHLFHHGYGFAALENNQLVGFICGYKINNFFSSFAGIYCPVFGHGAKSNNRLQIYSQMYIYAAEHWVKATYLTHTITVFSHDSGLVDMLFWQGFGMRCVDAIRETGTLNLAPSEIQIKKLTIEDAEAMEEIHNKHNKFYRSSPIFMPKPYEDAIEEHRKWHTQKDQHEWAAYKDDLPIGIISIGPEAETFVSEHPSVMNIKGMFVDDAFRNHGVGALLLNVVQQWLLDNDYPLCGVDFESINTLGSKFWVKHFTPYTYSLVRRIDERIL